MGNFYDYENNRLYYVTKDNLIFDLQLNGRIVLISGESATGKTFLVSEISNYKRSCDETYDNDLLNVIIYNKFERLIDDKLLYIIDRGDLDLTDTLCSQIVDFQYARFLIFARGSYDLYIHPKCIGEFKRDKDTIRAVYPFEGWW